MKIKVYQRGQVVIPSTIRERLHIRPGDYVDIEESKGYLRIVPTGHNILSLGGSIKSRRKAADADRAIEESWTARAKAVANAGKSR